MRILALALLLAAVAPGRGEVLGWIITDDDPAYIRRVVALAPTYHVNHIQLSHDLVMFAEEMFDDPVRRATVQEASARCRELGITCYIWTHELAGVPDELTRDGKVDLDNPALAAWLTAKYARLFDLLPTVDGLVLTLSETEYKVFDDSQVTSSLAPGERIAAIARALWDACRARGKGLCVRTWGNLGTDTWWMLEEFMRGVSSLPPEITVMSKYTAGDWYMAADSPLIGAFPGRPQIMEFDLCGEHHGVSLVPWSIAPVISEQWARARSNGLAGAAGRIDRFDWHILGTPNEVNLHAFTRLVENPLLDPDKVVLEWLERRFGRDAARALLPAFLRSREVVEKTWYHKEVYFIQDHSAVPSLDYPARHLADKTGVPFRPEFAPIEAALLSPTKESARFFLAEKDEAVAEAKRSLAELDAARELLRPEDYAWLRPYFERSVLLAELFRELSRLYFAWATFSGPEDREALFDAVESLQMARDRIVERFGPDFRVGNPHKETSLVAPRVDEFISEIVRRLAPQLGLTVELEPEVPVVFPGEEVELELVVCSEREVEIPFAMKAVAEGPLSVEDLPPAGVVAAESTARYPIKLTVRPDALPGCHLVRVGLLTGERQLLEARSRVLVSLVAQRTRKAPALDGLPMDWPSTLYNDLGGGRSLALAWDGETLYACFVTPRAEEALDLSFAGVEDEAQLLAVRLRPSQTPSTAYTATYEGPPSALPPGGLPVPLPGREVHTTPRSARVLAAASRNEKYVFTEMAIPLKALGLTPQVGSAVRLTTAAPHSGTLLEGAPVVLCDGVPPKLARLPERPREEAPRPAPPPAAPAEPQAPPEAPAAAEPIPSPGLEGSADLEPVVVGMPEPKKPKRPIRLEFDPEQGIFLPIDPYLREEESQ